MTNLKIGILCNSGAWGGLEINLFKLAGWLKARGHEVTFFTNPQEMPFQEAEKAGLTVSPYFSYGKYLDWKSIGQLKSWMQESFADGLIIGHSKDIGTAVMSRWMSRQKPKLLYLQQMNIGVGKKDPLHTLLFSQLDAWITPLELQREDVYQKTFMPKKRVHLLPLCIELERFEGAAKRLRNEARAQFGLPKDVFVAGMIGRPDPGKGHLYFVEAIGKLKNQGLDVHGFILGLTGHDYLPYVQIVLDKIKTLGLEENITVHPFINRPELGYSALDAFVMASVDEAFGMVTIEAMASEVPVIGTNRKGPLEILKNGEYGLMIPIEDSNAIAKQLKWIIEHPKESKEMAVKAADYAQKHYSHHVMCESIEQWIRK